MQELPLERPGRGLRGLRNVVDGKLRGRHGKGGAAAGSGGTGRVVGTSLRRRNTSASGLDLPGPARPASLGASFGRHAASGPGTRWWSACVGEGPATGARGDDEVSAAGGAGGASRVPSPHGGRGRGHVPQGGFRAPPVGAFLMLPSSTPLGLPAGPFFAEGLLLVRTQTGDSGWQLRLRGTKRVDNWRGTELEGSVAVKLLLGKVAAGQVQVVHRAANVAGVGRAKAVGVGVARRGSGMRWRG